MLIKGGNWINNKLLRVGTIYISVTNIEISSKWYGNKLGAELSYQDADKAILNFANQSFFLIKSQEKQSANFYDIHGQERFSIIFEVDRLNSLTSIHHEFIENEIKAGDVENTGNNFVFYDLDGNKFDVWSELSPLFKEKYVISP